MKVKDFALLVAICLIWGASNVVSKLVVGNWQVPPLFFAAIRFALVLLVTLPWLMPVPRPVWRILLVGICMGAGNFALLFMGLQTSSPSAVAVVIQAGLPITTLLSIIMLGERIHWRRWLGITLTLIGVVIVVWKPGFALSPGLLFILGAAFAGSLGAIVMKQMDEIAPLRFQAWVGLTATIPLTVLSLMVEEGQWTSAVAAGWPFVAAVLFSALIVSVCAHTAYYGLIARYEANLLAPLTLITPLSTIGLGVLITGDQLDGRMIIGSALALLGVLIVALRRSKAPIAETQEHA